MFAWTTSGTKTFEPSPTLTVHVVAAELEVAVLLGEEL